jgi:hypothetical protein
LSLIFATLVAHNSFSWVLSLMQQAPCQRPEKGVFLYCSKKLRGVAAAAGGEPKYIFSMRATRKRVK